MTTIEFLKELKEQRISVRLKDNDQLGINSPDGRIEEQVLNELRQRKPAIVELLKGAVAGRADRIGRASTQPHYELSAAQQRLWVLDRFSDDLTAYNIPYICYLNGPLNRQALQDAFDQLLDRHESLRTVFDQQDNQPVQRICPASDWQMEFEDWKGTEPDEAKKQQIISDCVDHPFDLQKGPLLKVALYRIRDDRHLLSLVLHHIIADAWSVSILLKELSELYEANCTVRQARLPQLDIQYKDFAHWQQTQLQQKNFSEQEQFWKEQLQEPLPQSGLTPDFERPDQKNYEGAALVQTLNRALVQKLETIGQSCGATLFNVLLASTQAFLHRYTNAPDIIVGTTSAGRNRAELRDQIGFYINILPLRQRFDAELSFRELIATAKQTYQKAIASEDYPFGELINQLEGGTSQNRNPIFDILVEMIGSELDESQHASLYQLDMEALEFELSASKFDLAFRFLEKSDGIHCLLEYDPALYRDKRIERFLKSYLYFLDNLSSQADQPIDQLEFLHPEEKQQLLHAFNQTAQDIAETTYIALWQKAAHQFAEQTALVGEEQTWTYAQLDELSDKLCRHLRIDQKVQNGDRIGILAGRTAWSVLGVLGALKAGAVFVPIDPDYPEEMMGYMLENAGIQTLLMSSQQLFSIPAAFEGQTVVLDMLPEEEQPTVEVAINPSDAAYMIYTSGSSGKPKGVLVSQGNIAHYLRWANEYYFGRSTDAAFGLFTSLSFDLSLTGLLGTLIRGACLQIFSEDRPSSEVLQSVFGPDSEVQATKLTPSHISLLDQIGLTQSPVQTVIVGGEALQPRQLECLFELNPGIVVHNEYGPTETTVGCTVESFTDPKQAINIGQPIANATAYVLNDSQQIVPIGTAGELYIGGRGVALAYHEQPALTAERFLDDPFRPGQRMYRTGDKACWLEDGRLQFLGRIDGQLKINGYRIEPALIESALLEISGIQQAVVLAAEGTSNRLELRAYLRGQQLDGASNIRSQLEQKIPHYMLPTAFYEITDIPLSTNGKVDANALLASRKAKLLTDAAYKAPENDMENFLLSVFAPLVSADPLSTRQNFFSVGLDSLKVVQAQTQLEARHPGSIKIHEIFSHPSIEKLSTLLSQRLGIQDTEEEETQILDF